MSLVHSKPTIVAVVAAGGKTGREVVARALKEGWKVRAGVRSMPSGEVSHDNLEYIRCDVANTSEIEELLHGVDAVIVCLGHVKGTPAMMQTDAMRRIIYCMSAHGIRRLVGLTGTGARMPGDTPNVIDTVLNSAVQAVDNARIRDGKAQLEIVAASDRVWTMFRVLKLTNAACNPHWTVNLTGPAQLLTSRKTVADAMVIAIRDGLYENQAPIFVSK